MTSGYKVEYSIDGEEVCLIPQPMITSAQMHALVKHFIEKGYKWWKPSDHRGGYVFSKSNKPSSSAT